MDQPVDFTTPQIFLAAAGIIAVLAIPLGIHALIRARKYRNDPQVRKTYARRRDITIEAGVAAVGIILSLVFVAVFAVGWNQSTKSLVANVETRYAVSDVSMTSWNGSWATVELTDAKGQRAAGIEVSFDAVGAPVLRDPAYGLDPKHAVKYALDLR